MAVSKTKTRMKASKVAIFIRSSREREGGEEETLFTQRRILTDIAHERGYSYEIYEGIESSINENSDSLLTLKQKLSENHYDKLLITKIDRLARDTGILNDIKRICLKNRILIETPSTTYDLTKKADKMMFNFQGVIAESEYDEIKDRLLTGKFNTVAKRNRWMGSRPPFGYSWDRNIKQLVVIPEEKIIVRKMVELASKGYSSRQIADKLNSMGYRGKRGSSFRSDSILRTLANKVYIGCFEYYSSYLDEIAVAKDCHEAMMTEEEYNLIKILMKSRVVKENMSSQGVKSPINKLLKCGCCGRGMSIQLNNKGISKVTGESLSFFHVRPCRYYVDENSTVKCINGGIKVNVLEEAILEYLKEYRVKIEESLKKLENRDVSEIQNQLLDSINTIKRNISRNQKRAEKVYEAYLDELITKEKYSNDTEKYNHVISELETELELLETKLNNLDTDAQKGKYLNTLELIKKYRSMPLEEQNATLKLLIKEIIYTRTEKTNNNPHLKIIWRELQ